MTRQHATSEPATIDVPQWLPERAERCEATWMTAVVAATPEPTRTELGLATYAVAGGVALSARHDPTRFLAKTVGVGFGEPVTDELVGRIIAFYRSRDEPSATLQFAPQVLREDWPDIAAHHGLTRSDPWIKHVGELARITPRTRRPATDVRVRRVAVDGLAAWGSTVVAGMGMPDVLGATLAAGAAKAHVHAFGAFDGDELVAGALLGVDGEVAGLGAAATLPAHRGRGAQGALIAARVEAARDAGCTWVVAETARADAGLDPSHRNLAAAGLRPLYVRDNWVWAP